MRLSESTADALPHEVQRPDYPRAALRTGIVHFGLGAFHRAHQAVYTDAALRAGERDWAIAGVSMRHRDVREQLVPQSGLYTVTETDSQGSSVRLIAAIRDVIVAPSEPERLLALLTAGATHIVSLTITEKGYLRTAAGSLNLTHPDLAGDLEANGPPRTVYGFLAASFRQRCDLGLPGVTVLSCDNLAANGQQLARLIEEFLQRRDPSLVSWFRRHCTCPSSMVDRIVPASTPALLDGLAQRLGQYDAAAVFTEPYRQWVIEDRFAGPRPGWEHAGVQWVADIASYELAKLRLLNGAHSALAYLGQFAGHRFVHEAIANPVLRALVDRLMCTEAAASLPFAGGFDPCRYTSQLIERFANPALNHRLSQIAADGSQKIAQRWLATLRWHQQRGTLCPALLRSLAAWTAYVRGDRFRVEDPLAAELRELWRAVGHTQILHALFGARGHFRQQWVANADEMGILQQELLTFLRGPR